MNAARRYVIVVAGILSISFHVRGQVQNAGTSGEKDARLGWWRDARFGMFIHWGLYSIPAGEWNGERDHAEWIRTTAKIPLTKYDEFAGKFNPVKFDAATWVRAAKNAGMKYITITTKHHDGFCLFDSKETEFDVMSTPFHRDIMKEMSDACRAEGIRLCWYHSIMDWHHPDYLPRRDWETDRSVAGADFRKYVDHLKRQLKELLTNYGPIGVLWFDGEWESTWNNTYGKEIYEYVKGLQPDIIVNNRVGVGREGLSGFAAGKEPLGDFGTPEQEIPATGIPGVDWETCMTMNDHWGYNQADTNFKSARELIRTLSDVASKGGNFLLNIGPTAQGVFPAASVNRLNAIGEWMAVNGEAIYGTKASPFALLPWGRCTMKEIPNGTRLYLHVFDWPLDGRLAVPGIFNYPSGAYLLADAKKGKLSVVRSEDALVITVPQGMPDGDNTIVVLDIAGKADVSIPPRITAEFPIFVDSTTVMVSAESENAVVRYSFDGSVPTPASRIADGPVHVFTSTVVSARTYRGVKAISPTSRMKFEKVVPIPAEIDSGYTPGVKYEYYEGEWDSLPRFETLQAVKKGILSAFSFAPRAHEERFGFVYTGFINIPRTDVYGFATDSDDGSRLYIDDSLTVDNDGLHGMVMKEGVVPLSRGFHRLKVLYFEKTGGDDLRVLYRRSGTAQDTLPASMLFHK